MKKSVSLQRRITLLLNEASGLNIICMYEQIRLFDFKIE